MTGVQILILFVGGAAFSITPLDRAQWAYSVVLGALSIPVGILIRLIPFEVLGGVCKWLPKWKLGRAALGVSGSNGQP